MPQWRECLFWCRLWGSRSCWRFRRYPVGPAKRSLALCATPSKNGTFKTSFEPCASTQHPPARGDLLEPVTSSSSCWADLCYTLPFVTTYKSWSWRLPLGSASVRPDHQKFPYSTGSRRNGQLSNKEGLRTLPQTNLPPPRWQTAGTRWWHSASSNSRRTSIVKTIWSCWS